VDEKHSKKYLSLIKNSFPLNSDKQSLT